MPGKDYYSTDHSGKDYYPNNEKDYYHNTDRGYYEDEERLLQGQIQFYSILLLNSQNF